MCLVKQLPRLLLAAIVIYPINMLSQSSASPDTAHLRILKRVFADSSGAALITVDSRNRRLYGGGNTVLDIDNYSVVGHLPASIGHGYAIAADLGRGVTRRGAIFDLRTLAILRAGQNTSGGSVAYDSASGKAFVSQDTILVVKVADGSSSTFDLGAEAMWVVTDDFGRAYFAMRNDSVAVVDARTLAVQARWGVGDCAEPLTMALDRQTDRLFVSCWSKKLIVLDTQNGRRVAEIPLTWPAAELAFDQRSGLIYNPSGDGTMTVVREYSPNDFRVSQVVQTAEAENLAAVDEVTHRVFLICRVTPERRVRVLVVGSN